MNLPYALLLDESVPQDVASLLGTGDASIKTVAEEGLAGRDDSQIIERARITGSIVVTQDAGFGRLALLQGKRCPGIVVLRPGHLKRELIVDTLDRLFADFPKVSSPFLIVVVRKGNELRIRARSLA